jgi:hypothetical protein
MPYCTPQAYCLLACFGCLLSTPLAYFPSFRDLLTCVDAARTRITENTCHVTATQPVHWSAGCCLHIAHVTWEFPTLVMTSLHLRGSVFTEPLPRNGLHNPVVLLLRVGQCVCCRCYLWMDLHVTQTFLKTRTCNLYQTSLPEKWAEFHISSVFLYRYTYIWVCLQLILVNLRYTVQSTHAFMTLRVTAINLETQPYLKSNSHSNSQGMYRFTWNHNSHLLVQNREKVKIILSQCNPVCAT